MLHPTVYNTSQICFQLGVRHAVLSPGSRNAPLTISFARHKEINKWIIPDERSAGFIALGIAQQTKTPVVLCCTSGSALLNYAPAIAEAYYREIPLVVLSADRPPELIDQRDGQTIRQYEALKNHVKASWSLPVLTEQDDGEIYQNDLIEALKMSKKLPTGPVHINVPFREPFYPAENDELSFHQVEVSHLTKDLPRQEIIDSSDYNRILLLVGQFDYDKELNKAIGETSAKIPVLRSPLNNLSSGISHYDAFLNNQEELKPDLLITSGLSVLSKKTKNWIRKHKPNKHIHFDPGGIDVDTFQTSPELIRSSLMSFLNESSFEHADKSYLNQWKYLESITKPKIDSFFKDALYSESKAAYQVLSQIPHNSYLHLSNSMPVRYADLFGVPDGVKVYANRGTSGIDGCTSTMIGSAIVNDQSHVLLTGDLAFLYDRNAFFHNYVPSNIRMIILNNQGGGIFRLIDGPAKLPELEDYFETRHNRTAEYICMENDLEYVVASNEEELTNQLRTFFEASEKGKVLEIFTDPMINQTEYNRLKKSYT